MYFYKSKLNSISKYFTSTMGNSSNSGEIAYKKVDVAVEDLEKEGPKKKLTPKK